MNDQQLLELAAKAANIVGVYHEMGDGMRIEMNGGHTWWNPLNDDGDALRLAVKLDLVVSYHPALEQALVRPYYNSEKECLIRENIEENHDRYAATRRAIVRAAAAIGEKL